MDFDAALETHLDAIRRRDLDAFAATVHEDVTLVLPNGTLVCGRDEVVDFHRGWFGSDTWRMDLATERRVSAGDTEVAVFLVDYHDADDGGAPYHRRYRLAMVFARHDGEWLLLHDQNTLV
ncbi:YybH family protein [Virgisporangium aurantiacum]|nr:SgcJ/EcaC family oxidoreductase [Virgisporangium aurantiacum]